MFLPAKVLMLKPYIGYFGYLYPKDVLCKNGKATKLLTTLAEKHSDLEFYDMKVFKDDEVIGLFTVEGCLVGKEPMIDVIEMRNTIHEYSIVKETTNDT